MSLKNINEIVVRINSGGGDVFVANAIYTRLKDYNAKITVKIDGWVASAATIIAMAGDVIQIPENGVFMIHDPKLGACDYYKEEELRKLAKELEVVKESIINAYSMKTGKDKEEISKLMSEETWLIGQEAIDSGFCDELILDEVKTESENSSNVVVNSIEFNVSGFKNIPDRLLIRNNQRNDMNFINKVTVKDLTERYPILINEIKLNSINEERKRIKDIQSLNADGFEEIINKSMFEEPISAGEVAIKIVLKEKERGLSFSLGNLK